MAVALPLLATIGGGSALAGGTILGTAAIGAATGIAGARSERKAGEFQEGQARIDAAAEGDAARTREIERKRLLLRAIASQQAAAGAGGISLGEGSPAVAARLDIDRANTDLLIDTANVRQRQRNLFAQGRAARISGTARRNVGLLGTISSTASSFL